MSFLKQIGKAILTAGALVAGYGPQVAKLIPGDRDDRIIASVADGLKQAETVVINAEVFGQALQLAGPQKAAAAAPAMMQVLLSSPIMHGKKIKNKELAMKAATDMGRAMADFLNACEGE